ncbi:hypothetical protein D3C80_1285850 [compost metagenome]
MFQFGGNFLQQVLLHRLVIVGDVALVLAVIIGLAYRQRIERQIARNMIHDLLNRHHALRPAKATIGGIGRDMGFAAVTGNQHILQKISVIGVEHGAIDDRTGEIERVAAVTGQADFHPIQQTAVVKTDVILNIKRVAFAGDQHVVAAVQPHFDRPPGEVCHHRTQACRAGGLSLFAAKAAAHAPRVDSHLVYR